MKALRLRSSLANLDPMLAAVAVRFSWPGIEAHIGLRSPTNSIDAQARMNNLRVVCVYVCVCVCVYVCVCVCVCVCVRAHMMWYQ